MVTAQASDSLQTDSMDHQMEPRCDNTQLGHVEALAQQAHDLGPAEHSEDLEQEECVGAQAPVMVDNICGDHPEH